MALQPAEAVEEVAPRPPDAGSPADGRPSVPRAVWAAAGVWGEAAPAAPEPAVGRSRPARLSALIGRAFRAQPEETDHPWHLMIAWGSVATGIGLIYALLQPNGLVGPAPWWAYWLSLAACVVLCIEAYRRWPGGCTRWELHLRLFFTFAPVTASAYLTGWGPALTIPFLGLLAGHLRQSGSRAAGPVTGWAIAGLLAGQIAIAIGWAPSLISAPAIHGLALLQAACFTLAAQIVVINVRDKEVAQETLRRREALFRSLVQNAPGVVTIAGPDGTIFYDSPAVERLFGFAPTERIGSNGLDFIHADDREAVTEAYTAILKSPGDRTRLELRVRHSGGAWRWAEVTFINLLHDPTVAGLVASYHDIGERKVLEAELMELAFSDPLTRLGNRALFKDRLRQAGARARRQNRSLAVLFLDLDNFKTVNDTLGHAAGDLLLIEVGRRLHDQLREEDTAARLGGDEFAILLEDVDSAGEAIAVAERIIEALRRPARVDDLEIEVPASIGVVFSPAGQESIDELLRSADVSMYQAKLAGKGRFALYEPAMHHAILERAHLEAELRRAIAHQELIVHYQPTLDLRTGRVTGCEALVRWDHPRRGLLSPVEFIAAAEESGLIVEIGREVLRQACEQAAAWQAERPDVPLTMSVNVSGRQLQHPDLVDHVAVALAGSGIEPGNLVLELTESVLIRETDLVRQKFRALKALGVRLAIDDFGTGYSSLGYLRDFPVDILKMDRTFISEIESDGQPGALARVILALGQTLDLQTVAEGIETADQLACLRDLGCDLGQGFYWAEPRSAEAIAGLLLGAADPRAEDLAVVLRGPRRD